MHPPPCLGPLQPIAWSHRTPEPQTQRETLIRVYTEQWELPWCLRRQRTCPQCGRPGFDLRVGKIPRQREWQPTPGFLPRKSMDRGAWRATVPGAAKSQTRLSDQHFQHYVEEFDPEVIMTSLLSNDITVICTRLICLKINLMTAANQSAFLSE